MTTSKKTGRESLLQCAGCGIEAEGFGYECGECHMPLVVRAATLTELRADASAKGVWRFPGLLPPMSSPVTLGEGDTPLLALKDTLTGVDAPVFAKMESLNPTLSFKDRALSVGASLARQRGFIGLVVASTGNAAASAAAYAAAAGLECRITIGTESRAAKKLEACRALGATVVEVPGDYSTAYASVQASESAEWMNVSTTYRNPYLAEGYRSLAFELLAEMTTPPATIVVPIGAGPYLRGIGQGFQDAVDVGLLESVPRLVGVQALRVAPIFQRWHASRSGGAKPHTDSGPTRATAIADNLTGYEFHGEITMRAIDATWGTVVAVSEGEIISATRALAAAGMWVEPSAATALAALGHLDSSFVGPDAGPIAIMLTGHGAKGALVTD